MGLSMLAQHPITNSVAVHATAVFFTGVSLITWGIWTSRIGMLVSGISFGFFVSCMGHKQYNKHKQYPDIPDWGLVAVKKVPVMGVR